MTISAAARVTTRPFDPERDYPAMAEMITAVNRHDRMDWIPTAESLASDWQRSRGFDPARDVRLVERDGTFLAGVAFDWRERSKQVIHDIEVWVRPGERRRGLGRQLVRWAEARARDSVRDGDGGPGELPHLLQVRADSVNLAAVAFATAMGYRPVRYGFVMHRQLDQPIPEVPMPAGLEVRPVLPEQHRAIFEADVEAFRDHWEPAERDDSDFERMFAHPDVDTSLWQVAWEGDRVAGSVVNGIYPHENEVLGMEVGWFDHVSVRRPWRGRGLASALIVRSLAILRDKGMDFAALGVDAENPTGALGLYEKFGFAPRLQFATYRKPLEEGAPADGA